MNCDVARELLFAEQEGLLEAGERAALRAHLETCAACRAEEAALLETYAVLARGVQEMAAPVTPSPRFWQSLNAELDAVDAERQSASSVIVPARSNGHERGGTARDRARALQGRVLGWPRRWVAAGALLAALLSGTIIAGGPQQAWAALRHLLYFVPFIGVGQVEPTALVAVAPASASNGAITLTVTGLVSGRHTTLVSYVLSGQALAASGSTAPVADAVDATLIGAQGRRYVATSWLPIQLGVKHGVPQVRGMLAFRPLASNERLVQLVAVRMPLAPPAPRPWSLRLALQTAGSSAAQTSVPVDSSATHHGIRVAVTDVTFLAHATVVDMDSAITGGPYAGGSVMSLEPEQAVGNFTPILSTGRGATLTPAAPALPAPVRQAVLPRPEFVYGPVGGRRAALSLTLPAVEVRLPGSANLTARSGMSPTAIKLGSITVSLAKAQVVMPPAALGLDGERRLRLTLAFLPLQAGGTVQSVDVVVDGVSRTVSRDAPQVEIPLAEGQQEVQMAVENPLVAVQGPWIIALSGQGQS